MTVTSEPIDPALFGPDSPRAEKLFLQILPDEGDLLDVTISLKLDPAQAAEQEAIDAFAPDALLTVRHTAKINLQAERTALSRSFEALYRKSSVSQDLRAPQLVSLRSLQMKGQLRREMLPIALRGSSIHRRLLSPTKLRTYGDVDAPLVKAALQSALRRRHLLHVMSPVSLFPWTFLYDGEGLNKDDLSTLDLTHFWGFRHQIQEEIEGTSRRLHLPAALRISAAVCPTQDVNAEHRSGPLGKFAQSGPGAVQWLACADDLRDALTKFPSDCLYFYGHAGHDHPPTPTTSRLRLEHFDVTVEEICQAGGPAFEKSLVLAILNGCETTPLDDWNEDSFVGLLCLQGDRRVCCVSTFAEVPAAFALRFGQRLWAHFLEGSTLGTSILRARRDLLKELGNPLGLLYTLFGRIETQIG